LFDTPSPPKIKRAEDAKLGLLDLLQKLLSVDPDKRMSAQDTLDHFYCKGIVPSTVTASGSATVDAQQEGAAGGV
jgi:serine/threonine protein kinase